MSIFTPGHPVPGGEVPRDPGGHVPRGGFQGANDGLVSNALSCWASRRHGYGAARRSTTGVSGLLASAPVDGGRVGGVRSQRELLDASIPGPRRIQAVTDLVCVRVQIQAHHAHAAPRLLAGRRAGAPVHHQAAACGCRRQVRRACAPAYCSQFSKRDLGIRRHPARRPSSREYLSR